MQIKSSTQFSLTRIATLIAAMTSMCVYSAGLAAADRDLRRTLEHGGLKRQYILHLPPPVTGAQPPRPLIVALHAGGGRAAGFARSSGFSALADKVGFAVVYPQAVERHWNDGRTRIGFRAHAENIDDVGFVVKLIDTLAKRSDISRERVFVAGAANGGMLAMRIACDAADKIHGVAAVMANFPERLRFRCAPKRPVPILVMNGTADPIMPWRGGEMRLGFRRLGKVLSAAATTAYWAEKNGCADDPREERLPDKAPGDGTEVRKDTYENCAAGSRVVLYTIDRGGHTWPGGRQVQPESEIGKVSRDIVAQDEIWAFFKSLRPAGAPGLR